MRWTFALLVVAAACRRDGRSPERETVHPVQQGSATVQSEPAGSAAVDHPATPPPGDDKLVNAPADVAGSIAIKEIAHGLRRPVLLVTAPGDTRKRLFIIEQHAGAIRVLENGALSPKPFFTISDISKGNEQGLLGLAFHPQFAQNGRLYINYTSKDASTHVVEYRVGKDPDAVDPSTRRELLHIEQPYSNHNGGHVEFGPDGKLYTGMGDGGAANDPHGNGQNDKALLAKLLRIDVEAKEPKPEIVHLGLRNPWRFSFDRKTGDLLIGDVGQNLWESVHGVVAGDTKRHNFGWNIVEGTHCFNADTGGGKKSCDKTGLTPPLAEYPHDEGCSITGGYVYRGKALPALDGRYFYADYCTGLLRSFKFVSGYVREHWNWKPMIDREGVLTQISSFGLDHDGELYIVELTGSIYQLVPKS
ncbi:MAG TPA: PQQ-dependent sugar dehydrogenase [Kofleriaceae bacterium]